MKSLIEQGKLLSLSAGTRAGKEKGRPVKGGLKRGPATSTGL
ncbi:MAG: hypothetical protein ACXV8M_10905 [Candidatus Angelobacter sp.]